MWAPVPRRHSLVLVGHVLCGDFGRPVWGPGGFAPYTVLPFVCPVIAFLLAWFGIGISKLTPEEIAEELQS